MAFLTRSVTLLLSLAALHPTRTALAQTVPAGWRLTPAPEAGVERRYEATSLPAGQYLRVEQTALQPLSGAPIERWLPSAIAADPSPGGAWMSADQPTNVVPAMMATITREFRAQLAAVEFSTPPGPGHPLRWGVPAGRGHDDLVMSAAMVVALEGMSWRQRVATGSGG